MYRKNQQHVGHPLRGPLDRRIIVILTAAQHDQGLQALDEAVLSEQLLIRCVVL